MGSVPRTLNFNLEPGEAGAYYLAMKKMGKAKNLADELAPFENKWVALVEDKVIASGKSPKEVKELAEQQGFRDYVFHLVPSFSRTFLPHEI